MPEDMSDRMPEDMPHRMPEDLPEDMPEHMPEDMPDRMPDRMSEDMSDRMPEDLRVRKCINAMVRITRSKVIFKAVSGPPFPENMSSTFFFSNAGMDAKIDCNLLTPFPPQRLRRRVIF